VETHKILNISSGILFLALLGGCSQNNVKQTEIDQQPVANLEVGNTVNSHVRQDKVVIHQPVTVATNTQQMAQRVAQQQAAQRVAQQQAAQRAAQQRATQQAAKKRQLQQQKRYAAQRHAVRQAPPRRYIPKPPVRKLYTPRKPVARTVPRSGIYVAPKTASRQYRSQPYSKASLTGDFANNTQAHRFIDKMVARHGFDRRYLNGVLSNAKATTWMKKMAAKDERPRVRKKKKRSRTPSWTRYRSHFITSRHINAGVAFYRKNRRALERAERQFGVPKEYILGILGVETIFGGNVGKNRAIDALTTMAFRNKRRGRYFASELESYLLMTRSTRLNPLTPKASYAGALGLSQFMPSNIKRYGVDFDGDGGVNLWEPDDAIASIARYFKAHGWRTGEMVAVPALNRGTRYRSLKTGYKYTYSASRLSKKGISARYQHNMRGSLRFIKLNARGGDELWIGGKNFYVITRYNHSTHYAMAVHQLAQAIKQRIEPRSRSRSGARRSINIPIAPTKKRPISVEEAMELLSASNERKDAIVELRELIARKSLS